MPLPKPNPGENQKDFNNRCMANPTMNADYKDSAQRFAVCTSLWEKKDQQSMESWVEALQLDEVKKWYLIIPKGRFEHPEYGTLEFNDSFLMELLTNYRTRALGETRPFVDEDHDEGKALGWFEDLELRQDGLWGLILWTQEGQQMLKQKTYRYFSPWIGPYTEPKTGKKFERVFRGGALTNVPFLKMLPEFDLKEHVGVHIKLSEMKETKTMDIKKLMETLGIESEDEILSKVEALVTSNKELSEALKKNSGDMDTLKKELAEIKKTAEENKDGEKSEEMKEVLESNKKLSEKIHTMERKSFIEKALSEGRIAPAKRKYWEDLFDKDSDTARSVVEELPKTIQLSGKGRGRDMNVDLESEEDAKAAALVGMTPEEYKKFSEANPK